MKARTRLNPFSRRSAMEHAESIIAECISADCGPIDALDDASNRDGFAQCPAEFSQAQKDLVHRVLLKRYLNAIGRA